MNYYLSVLKNYATFTGRARRSEYWYFVLFNIIFCVIAMFLDQMLGTTFTINSGAGAMVLPYGYIYVLYALIVFLPGLAVTVRRMHDIGKSGWFILVSAIPIAGAIWLLILLCTDSIPGKNKYGTNPKGVGNYDEIDAIGSELAM